MKSMISRIVPNFLYFSGLSACFKPFSGSLGAVLQLQRVAETERTKAFNPNRIRSTSPAFIDLLLGYLRSEGYSFVSLDQMVEELQSPKRTQSRLIAIAITLPYRETIENAVPQFRSHDAPFTVFVAPGMLEGEASLWWEVLERIIDKRKVIFIDLPKGRLEIDTSTMSKKTKAYHELHDFLICNVTNDERDRIINDLSAGYEESPISYTSSQLVSWDMLSELSTDPLFSAGATGLNYRVLSKLNKDECHFEIARSRDVLKLETGIDVRHFSVPFNDFYPADQGQLELIEKAGYQSGLTTSPGIIYPVHSKNTFTLPALPIRGDRQSTRYIKTELSGLPTALRIW